jgi:hypothetical protein
VLSSKFTLKAVRRQVDREFERPFANGQMQQGALGLINVKVLPTFADFVVRKGWHLLDGGDYSLPLDAFQQAGSSYSCSKVAVPRIKHREPSANEQASVVVHATHRYEPSVSIFQNPNRRCRDCSTEKPLFCK